MCSHEIIAAEVVGDMAYTVGYEHTQASVDGQPRRYTMRATQVYRREDGAWRVAHRHADTGPDIESTRRSRSTKESHDLHHREVPRPS